MSTLDRIMREEARLIILKTLSEQSDGRLNSEMLRAALQTYGITRDRAWVHDEMNRLADLGAISVIETGTVKIGTLTARGADHVARRIIIEGVRKPSLPEA